MIARWALVALALLGFVSQPAAQDAKGRPNIVFILADDLGYGDLGCTGAPDIRTPNIDSLARDGLRFRRFYSNGPECTPTRAALMTGRYPQRVGGLECAIGVGNVGRYDEAIRLAERHDLGLPVEETSIARLLKDGGYATALAGKWHLGYEPKFLPRRHGFDESFGPLGGAIDYYTHVEPMGQPMLFRNDERVEQPGYMTDLIAADAVRFLRRHRDGPFFLYAAFTAPHNPYQGPGSEKEDRSHATYAAMVERLDHGVGEILKTLDDQGLAKNTMVVFNSDNGGTPMGRNAPYTRNKGTTFEGGIHVPCLVRWPGVFSPGSVSEQVGVTMDLTASIARVAGVKPAARRPFDGIDVLAAAQAGRKEPRQLFWRIRRGEETRWGALDGDLKYVRERERGTTREFLFDVERDPPEQRDLLNDRSADAERLRALLAKWEDRVRNTRGR